MSAELATLASDIAEQIADAKDMKTYSNEFMLSQLGKLSEETGEAWGAYLRANGFARRRGNWSDFEEEVADVVITAYVVAASAEFDLDAAIERKLAKVMTRGWHDTDIVEEVSA